MRFRWIVMTLALGLFSPNVCFSYGHHEDSEFVEVITAAHKVYVLQSTSEVITREIKRQLGLWKSVEVVKVASEADLIVDSSLAPAASDVLTGRYLDLFSGVLTWHGASVQEQHLALTFLSPRGRSWTVIDRKDIAGFKDAWELTEVKAVTRLFDQVQRRCSPLRGAGR